MEATTVSRTPSSQLRTGLGPSLAPKGVLILRHGNTLCQEQRHRKSLFLVKDFVEIEGKLSSPDCLTDCIVFLGNKRGISALPEREGLFLAATAI